MKWAVERFIFDTNHVRTKIRKARKGEVSGMEPRQNCDFYVDVFDTEEKARKFAAENQRI